MAHDGGWSHDLWELNKTPKKGNKNATKNQQKQGVREGNARGVFTGEARKRQK